MNTSSRYSDSEILSLIQILYEVSEDLDNWQRFLERLREITRSDAVIIRSANHATGQGYAPISAPYLPIQLKAYKELYHPAAIELFQANNPLFVTPGAVSTREVAISDEDFLASRLYREFFGPLGWFHFLNCVFDKSGPVVHNLSLMRTSEQGPVSQDEVDLLRKLIPHMRRSMQIYRQLREVSACNRVLGEVIDCLPIGVLLANSDGRVFASNRTAQDLFAREAGLGLSADGQMRLKPAQAERRLLSLIAEAAAVGLSGEGDSASHMIFERGGQRAPLSLMVFPAGGHRTELMSSEACAAIYVSDPDNRINPSESLLRGLYQLTRAEARLASLLVRGLTVEQAAERLKVTRNTIRTHLKRVFSKTHTKRQADLVSLMLSGVEALRVLEER